MEQESIVHEVQVTSHVILLETWNNARLFVTAEWQSHNCTRVNRKQQQQQKCKQQKLTKQNKTLNYPHDHHHELHSCLRIICVHPVVRNEHNTVILYKSQCKSCEMAQIIFLSL